jgi:trk system potassium uptake protein TrkA
MKIAVIGAGKLGMALTTALLGCGYDITLVDKEASLLQKAENAMDVLTVQTNAKSPDALKRMNIDEYDFVIAVANEDEKNLVIAKAAKQLGAKKAIARVRDPEYVHQRDFLQNAFDVDFIVNPDRAMAYEINRYLVQRYDLNNGYFNTGAVSIIQWEADNLPSILGKTVSEIAESLGDVLIVAVSRGGKIIVPNGQTVLHSGDTIYLLGRDDAIRQYTDKRKNEKARIEKVMIAGGGKTAFYLAELLADHGVFVKIIEIDRKRCEYLASHLGRTMILCGDATDVALLEQEDIDEMDAFVSLTNFDEENLLLALQAYQRNIKDVIAKVSRKSYGNLIEQMGISVALNPTDITVAQILRFVQGRRRVIFSKVIQGQAEFIEIVAETGMNAVLNRPLKDITFPPDVLLAGILRGNDVLIPHGNTVIYPGDHLIVFCLLSQIAEMEELFQKKEN